MKLTGLALLVALTAGCSSATAPPQEKPPAVEVDRQPSWNPDGTRIVYKHGWDQLRILDLASGTSTDIGVGFEPKWSPDGKAIAYHATDGVHIHDLATGGDTLVLSNDLRPQSRSPAWSWDSQWLAIEAQPDSTYLILLNVATGTQVPISVDFVVQPCWMPGDSELVVAMQFPDGRFNLATLGLDGKVRNRLTQGDMADRQPVVSPEGQRIAWLQMAGQPGIHIMPVSGGFNVLIAPFGQDPAWSADGTRIAYTGYNSDSNTYTLWTMRPDGTDKVRLTAP